MKARTSIVVSRIFRPLLKVNLLAYRADTANALFPTGAPDGEVAGSHPARMLFIGDVGAFGYGVLNHGLGVVSQTARYVARTNSIGCSWTAIADPELTMTRAANELRTRKLDFDAVVVLLGPPDVLLATSTVEWSSALGDLIQTVRLSANANCPVIVAAIPPMHRFRSMPMFVQRVIAAQIQRLDEASASVAQELAGVTYSPFPSLTTAGMFIEDALNWRTLHSEWGKQLGATAADALRSHDSAH